jgi:hypothetical protein
VSADALSMLDSKVDGLKGQMMSGKSELLSNLEVCFYAGEKNIIYAH